MGPRVSTAAGRFTRIPLSRPRSHVFGGAAPFALDAAKVSKTGQTTPVDAKLKRSGMHLRSDAIDQILSTYLKQPARVSWTGALADSVRGQFDGARLELSGVSVLALPFDRLVFESERFQLTPGIPASIAVTGPRVELSIDQRQLDRWLARSRAPFALHLQPDGIEFRMKLRGINLSRVLTRVEVVRGWVVLRPKHAEVLGLRNRLAGLFRTYLPLPRLAPESRVSAIRHARGKLRIELTLDDFDDEITPGLVDRLQSRFVPFAKGASLHDP